MYNVTLDGVIIVCTSSIFLMLLTLQNTIRLFLVIVCTSQTTLGDRSLIQQGGEAFVREFGASTQAEEVFVDNR